MADATTPTTSTSSFLCTLSPSNNNHTNDTMEDAMTTTMYSSSSPLGLTHAVTSFDNKFEVKPHAKASFSSSSLSNPLPSNNNHTNDTMEDAMTTTPYTS